jgi:hypothetical protein
MISKKNVIFSNRFDIINFYVFNVEIIIIN